MLGKEGRKGKEMEKEVKLGERRKDNLGWWMCRGAFYDEKKTGEDRNRRIASQMMKKIM